MDRREALKNISLAFGCTISTPTLFNILLSCTEENNSNTYQFLNQQEAFIINQSSKFILPVISSFDSETFNLTRFTDSMLYHTVSKEEQELFNLGSNEFIEIFENKIGKNILEGTNKDFEKVLKAHLDIPENKTNYIFEILKKPYLSVQNQDRRDYLLYTFLTKMRYYCLFGYCTSEYFIETNA